MFYIIIYIETEETIVLHCDCNFLNLCVKLKTGGDPEKQLELQKNDVLIKYGILGYKFFLWCIVEKWACCSSNNKVNFRVVEIYSLICNTIVVEFFCERNRKKYIE